MNKLEITMSHLAKSFERPILKDINLNITNESYISVIGASGSGKSTLMNIIGLVEEYDSGEFLFNGKPVKHGRDYSKMRRENVGFVFQSYNLVPTLNCEENILLPAVYKRKAQGNRFADIVERLRIGHLLSQKVTTLSGGEKQRVAFARALMLDPCILIADEPTGNLDPENRDVVLDMLDAEHNNGRAVLLITHDMEIARRSKSLLLLKEGVLKEIEETIID